MIKRGGNTVQGEGGKEDTCCDRDFRPESWKSIRDGEKENGRQNTHTLEQQVCVSLPETTCSAAKNKFLDNFYLERFRLDLVAGLCNRRRGNREGATWDLLAANY